MWIKAEDGAIINTDRVDVFCYDYEDQLVKAYTGKEFTVVWGDIDPNAATDRLDELYDELKLENTRRISAHSKNSRP